MLRKRFYKQANAQAGDDGQWHVLLDGRELKTPARNSIAVPEAAAKAIAAEWQAQGDEINPSAMPLTRLLNTALDRVPAARPAIIAELLAHVDHDCLCHRAPHPDALAIRQATLWQPWLDWAATELGTAYQITDTLSPPAQAPALHAAMQARLEAMDDVTLACYSDSAPLLTSLVLTLALYSGKLTPAQAQDIAELEALYQAEQWGDDHEAKARLAQRLSDLEAAYSLHQTMTR